MPILVVTGTNTDVGKTIATAALGVCARRAGFTVIAVKPAQTGEREGDTTAGDCAMINRLTDNAVTCVEYARYPEPLAPNQAARRAGMNQLTLLDTADKIAALDGDDTLVLVEGAGGLLVHMAEDWNIADLAKKLSAPLVVVTSTGLGSLNLAQLTVEAAHRRGVEVAALIGGSLPVDPDLATGLNLIELPIVTGVPLIGSLPEGAGSLEPNEFVEHAPQWLDTAGLFTG